MVDVWIAGRARWDGWDVLGVFQSQSDAAQACRGAADFVHGPFAVGKNVPDYEDVPLEFPHGFPQEATPTKPE